MKKWIENRWVLVLVLLVFISLKLQHLFYQYFWDESWPYASAIRAMHDNGISLMPNAIDSDLSHGHPLFFHALAASWMKIFGDSYVAMHSMALFIAVITLIAIHEIGMRLFNFRVAILATLLIASQEMFFVQSSFVLLEILVAGLCFVSIYFYVKDKYILTIISLTLLFYTKESGLVMGITLGTHAFVTFFLKGVDRKIAFKRLLSVSIPLLFIGAFLLLQKHFRGWYFFPGHMDYIQHEWNSFWFRLRLCAFIDTLSNHNKYLYFFWLVLIGLIASIKQKKIRYLAIILPITFVYILIYDVRPHIVDNGKLYFLLFITCWFLSTYFLCHSSLLKNSEQRKFFAIASSFILFFLIFSSANFYTGRYMLVAIIPLMFLTAILFDLFITDSYKIFSYASFPVFGLISYFAFSENKNHGDTDLGSFNSMKVQQSVIDYMEKNNLYNEKIATGAFLERMHLSDPTTGFLRNKHAFSKVAWEIDTQTKYVIFDNIETLDWRYDNIIKDTISFKLVYRYEENGTWAEIYRRK